MLQVPSLSRAPYWKALLSTLLFALAEGCGKDTVIPVAGDGTANSLHGLPELAPPPQPPANPEIAYVVPGTSTKIKKMNEDGSNQTLVIAINGTSPEPVWSPDATAIAYVSSGPAAGLWRVNADGTNATLLLTNTDCGEACFNPRWSPLGDEIAVLGGGNMAPVLLVVSAAGGPPQVLYAPTPGDVARDVAWSSDGLQLSVVEVVGGLPDRIRIVDRATGAAVTVLEGPFDTINSIDWARQGVNQLVFEEGNTTTRSIYTLDVSQPSSPVFVTNGMHPCFSANNSFIAFVEGGRNKTVTKLNLATGAKQELARGVQPDWRR